MSSRKLAAVLLPSPGDGPTPAQQESGHFELFFHGLAPAAGVSLSVRVSGDRDPGYGATSRMLGESAVCLASDGLTADGGFYTPAAAMAAPLLVRLRAEADIYVGDNEPYSGHLPGDSMDRHGTVPGRPHVLIELRNDLIETPEQQEHWGQRLAPILDGALADAGC